jgi:hypothetical protein
MRCSGWLLTFWVPIWLPQQAAHPPSIPPQHRHTEGGEGVNLQPASHVVTRGLSAATSGVGVAVRGGGRPVNNLPKQFCCRCRLRGRMTRMTTAFDRTSAPHRKEWLGLRPRRLRWSEPHPCYLKHNSQTAAGRGLVILRQQICRYCSCWWRRWRQRQRQCDAIGGKALVGGQQCG